MTVTINGSGPITGSDRAENGTNDDITSLGAVASINGGPLGGMRNRIINGNFSVWQRGTSFAGLTNLAYSVDRWAVYNSLAGRTISRQAGFSGAQYCARVQRDSGNAVTGAIGLFQPIESLSCYPLQGKTLRLSFSARAGANLSGVVQCVVYSGTTADQGAAALWTSWAGQTTIGGGAVSLTTSVTNHSYVVTVPQDCLEIGILLYAIPVGTAGAADYFEITNVQLEVGSVATPFEHRPYGMELALCQRYYETGYTGWNGYATNGNNYSSACVFKTTKRATPTISGTNTFATSFVTSVNTTNIQTDSAYVYHLANATAAGAYTDSWTASAEL